MPAAIRMANGTTYYPGGFEHRADSGHGSNGRYVPRYKADAGQMLREGWVRNSFKDLGYHPNVDWIRPETEAKWRAEYEASRKAVEKDLNSRQRKRDFNNAVNNAVNEVKAAPGKAVNAAKTAGGAVGNAAKTAGDAIRNTSGYKAVSGAANAVGTAIKNEGANIKRGAFKEQAEYVRTHPGDRNEFGYALAGAKGAIKGTTGYKVGKAAVTKAGTMLANGAGFVGRNIKKGAGFVGEKVSGAFNNIKGAVGKAAGNVAEFAKSAAGRVANDFKGIANAIGETALGKAARRAGETALRAGGNVVSAVGNALEGIVKFFGGAIDSAKTAVRGIKNRRKNGTTYDEAIGPQPDLAGPQEQYGPWPKKK